MSGFWRGTEHKLAYGQEREGERKEGRELGRGWAGACVLLEERPIRSILSSSLRRIFFFFFYTPLSSLFRFIRKRGRKKGVEGRGEEEGEIGKKETAVAAAAAVAEKK